MQTIELVVKGMGSTERRERERVIDEANATFIAATKNVHALGEELVKAFQQMDAARSILHDEGLSVRAKFADPIDTAYNKWRGSYEPKPPDWLE